MRASPRCQSARRFYAVVLPSVVLAVISATPDVVSAQAGVVSGLVRDQTGRPLADAIVVLDPGDNARHAATTVDGRFRLTNVAKGAHKLRTVRAGYQSDERAVDVPASGLTVEIVLVRITQLDTIPVRASRTGIFGVVIKANGLTPVSEATIDVIGAHETAKTPANGSFNFPKVKEGAYVVYVKHKGLDSKMISVFVPHDGAVELAVTLDTLTTVSRDKQMAMALADFDERARVRGHLAAVIPRQEFAGHYGMVLKEALRFTPSYLKSLLQVDDTVACVFVNGQPRPMSTLNEFTADDVEAVEVYGLGQDYSNTLMDRWPKGMPCGNSMEVKGSVGHLAPLSSRRFGLQSGGESGRQSDILNRVHAVVIWLKK